MSVYIDLQKEADEGQKQGMESLWTLKREK